MSKVNNNINYHEAENRNKYHALCCGNCLFPIEYFEDVNQEMKMEAKAKLNKYQLEGEPYSDIFIQSNFYIDKCPQCGEGSQLVEIDYKLAPLIYKLNSKGFKTAACCSGHDCEKEYYGYFDKYPYMFEDRKSSYIAFIDPEIVEQYIAPILPSNWTLAQYKSDVGVIRSTRILGDPFNGYNDPSDPGYTLNQMIDKLPIIIRRTYQYER